MFSFLGLNRAATEEDLNPPVSILVTQKAQLKKLYTLNGSNLRKVRTSTYLKTCVALAAFAKLFNCQ